MIDEDTHLRLVFELERRAELEAAFAQPPPRPDVARSPPARPPTPAEPSLPMPGGAESTTGAPARVPGGVPPSWWREPEPPVAPRAPRVPWVVRVRELLASDLALHGLAYLGVLLMFVGTFGFVVFAYGELDRSLRPVAEAAVPLVCFLAACFLRWQRRRTSPSGSSSSRPHPSARRICLVRR